MNGRSEVMLVAEEKNLTLHTLISISSSLLSLIHPLETNHKIGIEIEISTRIGEPNRIVSPCPEE